MPALIARIGSVLAIFGTLTGAALAVEEQAILADRPPLMLSGFGFFSDLSSQRPAENVLPFAVNTPLFSDHATKLRFVYIPDGQAAAWDVHEAFGFPVGSALIKTFAMPADIRKPFEALRLIETRVLLKKETGWDAWAYLWNEDGSDAKRLVAGKKLPVDAIGLNGESLSFTYAIPNKNQCKGCHALKGEVTPIGPKARNLNGDYAYSDGPANQLETWIGRGWLPDAPDKESWPVVPVWTDENTVLDERARAWLDINCAHCHRRDGPASNSGLFLSWGEEDPVALGIGKRPVAAGRGSFGLEFDIAPGRPGESILFKRVESTEPGVMMPEIGRSLTDADAVALLREWIEAMR